MYICNPYPENNLTSLAQLILEGAVQLFVHTASKYDSCQILNFPHAKATLNLNWFCGGKDPNRHHYVVRCAPDKIPVQPDKQVFLASVFMIIVFFSCWLLSLSSCVGA